MERLQNIYRLGLKELRSLFHDKVLFFFVIYAFSFAIYSMATGISADVHNAAIAIADEDRSVLSARIGEAFFPPYFKEPQPIAVTDIDEHMDSGRYMFVIDIPPNFEADIIAGRRPAVQVNIDATAVMQAQIGAAYIQNIIRDEIRRFLKQPPAESVLPVRLETRYAFNPNLTSEWFAAIAGIIDMLTMLTIILTGSALIREREHGTVEHLLVMPLTPLEILSAKIWANGLVIFVAATLSLFLLVGGVLGVPFSGSMPLFLAGTALYIFFAASFGVFLGTFTRSMPQLGLLIILIILPMNMLSGSFSPIESQPEWLQPMTLLLASRHFVSIAQAILFRGAGFDIVWPEFAAIAALGLAFFSVSVIRFRRAVV
ncbi:ABC transporter, permease [Tepidicaulis marinus]|uniref:ABC transporter, permease n=1 Tax=Tepidicaulis marinus TaxID=1333998 RepID=A0A081BBK8_9HYPH|nr:ABC transporter permease [Tepidicaulis marinus]GAK45426.1 ABC transporter, permease [Tepidicaulis marinus]